MSNAVTRLVRRAALVALCMPVLLPAQAPASNASATNGHAIPVPSARAARRQAPVTMDGRLDEAAWQAATPITEFRQFDPDEGQPGTERTEVRFLFDDGNLYVGARLFDSQGAAGVRTSLVRRDGQFNSDFLQVAIDGFHDHLGRAFFEVNPSGSKGDYIGVGTSCCDQGWDPIWEAATSIDSEGWTAELRIPLSQLRYAPGPDQTWGMQVRRVIHRRNETQQWAHWGKQESGGPSRFGHLEGLDLGSATSRLELLPYVAAKNENLDVPNSDPFKGGNVGSARMGLDLKYHLSPNFTLDATFNPDFGQVEADPAVVNLTAFETSFPERRPFFIAGAGVFGFGGFNCYFCSNVSSLSAFYSRRIGRAPQGAGLAQGEYNDVPEQTAILGAAKITGRTTSGWTLGLLNAVTGRERARVRMPDGEETTQVVEPLTNYFVGRVRKDLMQGNLVIGGIATSVVRDMEPEFEPSLTRHAELYGADMQYTFRERAYSIRGNVAFTNVEGSPEVMTQRQRAPARYYQRPDRKVGSEGLFTNALDPDASAMRGAGGYLRVGKDAGAWLWETAINVRTPGFEANDLAFLTRADYVWYNANVMRNWTRPTSWYRDFTVIAGGAQQTNWDGDRTDQQWNLYAQSTLLNFWNWYAFYIRRPDLLDDRLLRGGPVVEKPAVDVWAGGLSSDNRRSIIWNVNAERAVNSRGGWGNNVNAGITYRPAPNVTLSLSPGWNDSRSILQYVRREADPTNTAFYWQRYVVASIDQKQVNLTTRLNWTFSPTMTFELFVQPLVASGDYFDFKQFNAPRQGDFSVFGRDVGTLTETAGTDDTPGQVEIDADGTGPSEPFSFSNPDFNFRSVRGNAVFRWEFRPGSVMYVAWAHSQSANLPFGDFRLGRDLNGLFSNAPNNVLLVKASFWMPR